MNYGDKAYYGVVLEEKITEQRVTVERFFEEVRWRFSRFPDNPMIMSFPVQITFPLDYDKKQTESMSSAVAGQISNWLAINNADLIDQNKKLQIENDKLKADNKKLKKRAADANLGQEDQ